MFRHLQIVSFLFVFAGAASGQVDEICGATGGSVWLNSSFVFGKIGLHGFPATGRLPKITVTVSDRGQNDHIQTIDRTGEYCFRDLDGGGGSITVEMEGVQVARRTLQASAMLKQYREDFDLYAPGYGNTQRASTISAKFVYLRTDKNNVKFEKAIAAEKKKDIDKAAKLLEEIISADPKDYVAEARLGSLYFGQKNLKAAEAAYMRSLSQRPDFSYAMMNLGRIHLLQNNVVEAIQLLEKATKTEPTAARGFQLLGEAYLLGRKGTLGVQALNEAIRLDPVGMAECHLLMARLYDRAGGKGWASREYELFLEKVPEHPERKKFEKYIKENPPETEKD